MNHVSNKRTVSLWKNKERPAIDGSNIDFLNTIGKDESVHDDRIYISSFDIPSTLKSELDAFYKELPSDVKENDTGLGKTLGSKLTCYDELKNEVIRVFNSRAVEWINNSTPKSHKSFVLDTDSQVDIWVPYPGPRNQCMTQGDFAHQYDMCGVITVFENGKSEDDRLTEFNIVTHSDFKVNTTPLSQRANKFNEVAESLGYYDIRPVMDKANGWRIVNKEFVDKVELRHDYQPTLGRTGECVLVRPFPGESYFWHGTHNIKYHYGEKHTNIPNEYHSLFIGVNSGKTNY